jgi:hypothetical protein
MSFIDKYPHLNQWLMHRGKFLILPAGEGTFVIKLGDAGGISEDIPYQGSNIDEGLKQTNDFISKLLVQNREFLQNLKNLNKTDYSDPQQWEEICRMAQISIVGLPPVENPHYDKNA